MTRCFNVETTSHDRAARYAGCVHAIRPPRPRDVNQLSGFRRRAGSLQAPSRRYRPSSVAWTAHVDRPWSPGRRIVALRLSCGPLQRMRWILRSSRPSSNVDLFAPNVVTANRPSIRLMAYRTRQRHRRINRACNQRHPMALSSLPP